MAIQIYKSTTPGRRSRASVVKYLNVSKERPFKALVKRKKRSGGRNQQGKLTMRHIGGGARKMIRAIDFKRDKFDIPGRIEMFEYDPGRSAIIARVVYRDGERRYILAPEGVNVGDEVLSSKTNRVPVRPGNAAALSLIPTGVTVSAIELIPGKGASLVRSAGLGATVMAHEGGMTHLRLPSGEVRMVSDACTAMIGQVSNQEWRNVRWGKAGRMRLRGKRPTVRGKAMNPVDHPHGGGEGGSPIGMKHPKTKWGKPALGVRTRKKKKKSNKQIVFSRHAKKR